MEWIKYDKEKIELLLPGLEKRYLNNKDTCCVIIEGKEEILTEKIGIKFAKIRRYPFCILRIKEGEVAIFLKNLLNFLGMLYVKIMTSRKGNYVPPLKPTIHDLKNFPSPFTLVLSSFNPSLLNATKALLNYIPKKSQFILLVKNVNKEFYNFFLIREKDIPFENIPEEIKNIDKFLKNNIDSIEDETLKKEIFLLSLLPFFDFEIYKNSFQIEEISEGFTKWKFERVKDFLFKNLIFTETVIIDPLKKEEYITINPSLRRRIKKIVLNELKRKEISNFLKRAIKEFEKRKFFESAIKLCREAKLYEEIGWISEKNKLLIFTSFEKMKTVKKTLEGLPLSFIKKNPILYALYADKIREEGDIKSAEKIINELIKEEKEELKPYLLLILLNIYFEAGKPKKAIPLALDTVDMKNLPPIIKGKIYDHIGTFYLLLIKPDKAKEYFFKAYSIFLEEDEHILVADVAIKFGNILRFYEGNLKSALKFYKFLSEIKVPYPRVIVGLFNEGDTLSLMGNFEDAELALSRMKEYYSFYPDFMKGAYYPYLKGRIALRKRDFDTAISCFKEILNKKLRPVTLFAVNLLIAESYLHKGNLKEGEKHIKRALKYMPERVQARDAIEKIKAYSLFKKGKIEDSISIFKSLLSRIKIMEEKVFTFYYYGKALLSKGDKQGERFIEEAEKIAKDMGMQIYFE